MRLKNITIVDIKKILIKKLSEKILLSVRHLKSNSMNKMEGNNI
jgi:hypothetical protein